MNRSEIPAHLRKFFKPRHVIKPKDDIGIPWRTAFALQADGWWLRSDIIWAKPSPMPESVTDRPTKAHEHVFLMSKSERYYYDADAIREELATLPHAPGNRKLDASRNDQGRMDRVWGSPAGRNKRSVWTIATVHYTGAHFAVFPPQLAEPCILAGTSARGCCPECGAPWERVVERIDDGQPTRMSDPGYSKFEGQRRDNHRRGPGTTFSNNPRERTGGSETTGWRPGCDCNAGDPVPCMVLDPFAGSGTVGMVATGRGRRAILIDLNPQYADMMRDRCGPLLESPTPEVA